MEVNESEIRFYINYFMESSRESNLLTEDLEEQQELESRLKTVKARIKQRKENFLRLGKMTPSDAIQLRLNFDTPGAESPVVIETADAIKELPRTEHRLSDVGIAPKDVEKLNAANIFTVAELVSAGEEGRGIESIEGIGSSGAARILSQLRMWSTGGALPSVPVESVGGGEGHAPVIESPQADPEAEPAKKKSRKKKVKAKVTKEIEDLGVSVGEEVEGVVHEDGSLVVKLEDRTVLLESTEFEIIS